MFLKQLLVRFGKLMIPHALPCFQRDLVGPLDLCQIVFWDKTHQRWYIGGVSAGRDFCLKFKYNEQGKLDQNGQNSDGEVKVLICKYKNEGWLGLGCAMIKPWLTHGMILEEEGGTCPLFDYVVAKP